MRVVVTGGSGFVGSALVTRLLQEGHDVVAPVRHLPRECNSIVRYVEGADLRDPGSWDDALSGAEVVVHAAARVHQLADNGANPLEYHLINTRGTTALAARAAAAGAKRFVFVSSIKVNGEQSEPGRPFQPDDVPAPADPYAISKRDAEDALFELGRSKGMDIVVVRPPLVYGPGVGANFRSLMTALSRGIPLPLGSVSAKRSFIARDNLVDFLALCATHSAAPGRVFLVSDGEDLGVSEMIRRLSRALGRPARLLPVPPELLTFLARAMGREDVVQRLCRPLQLDAELAFVLLGWNPPVTVDEAFQRTAQHFNSTVGR